VERSLQGAEEQFTLAGQHGAPQRGGGQPVGDAFQLGAGCFVQDEEHGVAAVWVEGKFADQLVPFGVSFLDRVVDADCG